MNRLSSFTLKMMAILFMAMDHIYTYLGRTGIDIPIWFGYIGRLASPIFFYLVVEGFFHTRSKKNYIQRVFAMGALMIGVDVLLGINNNIFLSIGCALVMLVGIDKARSSEKGSKDRLKGIGLAALFALLGVVTEAYVFGIGMVLVFYFFRDKKVLMAIVYVVMSLYPMVGMIGPDFVEAVTLWDYQWMMVFAIIPILMYNGKLGVNNKFVKWMFYWFYPIHLVLIVLLAKLIG
ncbi:MAG: TraX family protein [Cellulosilyticaceae bacterium]